MSRNNNNFREIMVNLHPEHRIQQGINNDGITDHADCDFQLSKPISVLSHARCAVRSAMIPLTFKNVVEGLNDRFIIKFTPTASTDDDGSVFITVQIPVGQYDTLSQLATAINAVLGTLNAAPANSGVLSAEDGGYAYTHTDAITTNAVLSDAMTCAVSTSAGSRDHLVFTLPANVVFGGTSVKSKDGSAIGATTLTTVPVIMFGVAGTKTNDVANRTAHKLIGFGKEKTLVKADGSFEQSPSTLTNIASSGARATTSDTLGQVLFTPYIYIRSNLSRSTIETKSGGTRSTDIMAKVPVLTSGYGDLQFYQADNNYLFFELQDDEVNNINIELTDVDGKLLPLEQSQWDISLVFKGEFLS